MECLEYSNLNLNDQQKTKRLDESISIIIRLQKLKCCMMTETEGHLRHFDGKIFVEKKVLSLHYF